MIAPSLDTPARADGEESPRTPLNPCTNCGDTSADVYCARCGEKQPNLDDLSVRHLAHEAFEELAHVDSKLVRTLRDLSVRPGLLPVEYFAGRKKRYVAPLRLFLVFFALQFVAYSFDKKVAIYSLDAFLAWDRSGVLEQRFQAAAKKQGTTRDQFVERVDTRWQKNMTLLQLANVIGVAVVLQVLYLRRRRYLAEHLVFSAYYLAFSYLMSLVVWPVYFFTGVGPGQGAGFISIVFTIVNLVYLYVGIRRFYGQSGRKTAVKTALLWGGIYFVGFVILIGSLVAAILQSR